MRHATHSRDALLCASPRTDILRWLNLAEPELGVLSSQCLDRRIADKQLLTDEVAAWQHGPNINRTNADWRFTTRHRAHQTQTPLPFNLAESGD